MEEVEPLGHGVPGATEGVWRVRAAGGSAILKLVGRNPDGHPRWPSSDEESSAYYWRREPRAYASGLLDALGGGLRAPRLLASVERESGSVALWLEDAGEHPPWSVERLGTVAERLGRVQGRFAAAPPDEPWLCRGWLRAYTELRREIIEGHGEPSAVWAERDRILGRVEAAPRTFAHHDFHPANLFGDGETVVVDWAYCGLGALGEDAGNLVADTLLDGVILAGDGPALREAVWDGYRRGLAESGCAADETEIRYVFLAGTALKFAWVPAVSVSLGLDEPFVATWLEVYPQLAAWAEEARQLGPGGR